MDIRMIKLRWSGFIALVLAVIGIVMPQMLVAETLPEPFKLIPQPRQMELIGGAGLKFGDLKAVLLNADSARPVTGPILSCLRQTDKDSKGVLSLKIAKGSSIPESSEGYILVIADGKAKITSCSPAGLFYGCQSLEQLLEDARDTDTPIPACKITDYPALSYRAVHFDVKHHLDTAKYYYDSIDRLARYKINAIIFEFEDKLRYKQQPLVGAPQAISISEMVALTNYARRRHIEITPLVQGLGHASYILKHQEYSHLREDPNSNWAFCPLNEGTYQVLFDLYRDAMEATPGSRYLHVGGDEVSKIGTCHRCKPFVEKKGIFELNLYWLNRVCEFVAEQGRVPIFWDDMPFKHAGVWSFVCYGEDNGQTAEVWEKGLPILNSMIERYPKNCIYMRWNYKLTRHLGTTRALDWYRDHGLTVMAATSSGGGKVLLEDRVNFIQSYISLAAERGIDGMLCTAWDDASPHMETFWRGFIASAEFSWSQSTRTLKEYEAAYLQRMFGPECATATNLYAELFEACQFWSKTLLAEGEERVRVRRPKKLISVPDLAYPGKWSQKYQDRLVIAEKEVRRYAKTSRELTELLKKARRNRHHLKILSSMNDFQVTGAQLLLALQKCDVAGKNKQKDGMKSVRVVFEKFDKAWKNLQSVYAETRFISYPENYLMYKGLHRHLANERKDLSWLIMLEEEYHKMLRNWLEDNDS